MLNRVTLIGNLGKDPEVRRLENGTAVAKFTLATNENFKDANGEWQVLTEWHEVVVWRNNAEFAEKYLKKGSMAFIEGKLTHRKYTDKTGIERYTTEIVANICRCIEKKESNSNFPNQDSPYAAGRSNGYTSTTSTPTTVVAAPAPELPKPVDFNTAPTHEMADAPSADMSGDLPF